VLVAGLKTLNMLSAACSNGAFPIIQHDDICGGSRWVSAVSIGNYDYDN